MDDLAPDVEPHAHFPPIPALLHSEFHEGPFTKCDACGADLLAETSVYQIQKNWKRGEVVFEIALCVSCLMETMTCLSKESMERLRRFQQEHYRECEDLDSCHFCRRSIGPEDEYEVGGIATRMFLARPPIVMCGDCAGAIQEQLSKKTRDGWSDFMDRVVPGVPGEMVPEGLPITF